VLTMDKEFLERLNKRRTVVDNGAQTFESIPTPAPSGATATTASSSDTAESASCNSLKDVAMATHSRADPNGPKALQSCGLEVRRTVQEFNTAVNRRRVTVDEEGEKFENQPEDGAQAFGSTPTPSSSDVAASSSDAAKITFRSRSRDLFLSAHSRPPEVHRVSCRRSDPGEPKAPQGYALEVRRASQEFNTAINRRRATVDEEGEKFENQPGLKMADIVHVYDGYRSYADQQKIFCLNKQNNVKTLDALTFDKPPKMRLKTVVSQAQRANAGLEPQENAPTINLQISPEVVEAETKVLFEEAKALHQRDTTPGDFMPISAERSTLGSPGEEMQVSQKAGIFLRRSSSAPAMTSPSANIGQLWAIEETPEVEVVCKETDVASLLSFQTNAHAVLSRSSSVAGLRYPTVEIEQVSTIKETSDGKVVCKEAVISSLPSFQTNVNEVFKPREVATQMADEEATAVPSSLSLHAYVKPTEKSRIIRARAWIWGSLWAVRRSYKIAGGTVVGAGAVGGVSGAMGTAAGAIGGLTMAPLTFGMSVPIGAALGGSVGMVGGVIGGATTGAAVATYMTMDRCASAPDLHACEPVPSGRQLDAKRAPSRTANTAASADVRLQNAKTAAKLNRTLCQQCLCRCIATGSR